MYGLKLKRIKSGLEVHEILSITQASQLEGLVLYLADLHTGQLLI